MSGSKRIDGSEHAFPHLQIEGGVINLKGGLSKRELFAALIMQGFAAKDPNKGRMMCDYEDHGQLAVERADNLIAALSSGDSQLKKDTT